MADHFTYAALPTVTSIAPSAGPFAGGTAVTINGTGLTGVRAVSLGGTSAASFPFHSDRLRGVVDLPGNPIPALMGYLPEAATGTLQMPTISASLALLPAGARAFDFPQPAFPRGKTVMKRC